MAVIVHGRMAIRPEMVEEARSAAIKMGDASRVEPGCNEYGATFEDLQRP